jgi:hypothetical protein
VYGAEPLVEAPALQMVRISKVSQILCLMNLSFTRGGGGVSENLRIRWQLSAPIIQSKLKVIVFSGLNYL